MDFNNKEDRYKYYDKMGIMKFKSYTQKHVFNHISNDIKNKLFLSKTSSLEDVLDAYKFHNTNSIILAGISLVSIIGTFGALLDANIGLMGICTASSVLSSYSFLYAAYNKDRCEDILNNHYENNEKRKNIIKQDVRYTINSLSRVKELKDDKGNIIFKPDFQYEITKESIDSINDLMDKSNLKELRKLRDTMLQLKPKEYINKYLECEKKLRLSRKHEVR